MNFKHTKQKQTDKINSKQNETKQKQNKTRHAFPGRLEWLNVSLGHWSSSLPFTTSPSFFSSLLLLPSSFFFFLSSSSSFIAITIIWSSSHTSPVALYRSVSFRVAPYCTFYDHTVMSTHHASSFLFSILSSRLLWYFVSFFHSLVCWLLFSIYCFVGCVKCSLYTGLLFPAAPIAGDVVADQAVSPLSFNFHAFALSSVR